MARETTYFGDQFVGQEYGLLQLLTVAAGPVSVRAPVQITRVVLLQNILVYCTNILAAYHVPAALANKMGLVRHSMNQMSTTAKWV